MATLAYKPTVDEVIERLRLLQSRRAMDQVFASFSIPSAALAEFGRKYREGFCDYPDPHERIAFWDKFFAQRAAVEGAECAVGDRSPGGADDGRAEKDCCAEKARPEGQQEKQRSTARLGQETWLP